MCARAPNAIAVDSPSGRLTYEELWDRVLSTASSLRATGISAGERVAILGQRSADFVIALTAILHVGGVAVPIDADLPEPRRRSMMNEAAVRASVLIAGAPENATLSSEASIDIRIPFDPNRREDSAFSDPDPDDPAYVFFTSGSTGIPKGVLGTHKGLSQFVTFHRERFGIGPADRVALIKSISFDAVLREVFSPLTSGATIVVAPDPLEPDRVLEWLGEQAVTVLHATPSHTTVWLSAIASPVRTDLRLTVFAGEMLTGRHVRRWRELAHQTGEIVNLYGPTETTMAITYHVVSGEPEYGPIPVGRPRPYAQAFVVDEDDRMCPPGVVGEVILRSPFRTRGYVNDPEAQARTFVPNPFTSDPEDIVYRSGDLGSMNAAGDLTITGRVDDQVQILGVRVEPSEVAVHLTAHPHVEAAAVLATTREDEIPSLVAFVVCDRPTPVTDLRQYLLDNLDRAKIPARFVYLDALPLNDRGKVDREALRRLDLARDDGRDAHDDRTTVATLVASLTTDQRTRLARTLRERKRDPQSPSRPDAARDRLSHLPAEKRRAVVEHLRSRSSRVETTNASLASQLESLSPAKRALLERRLGSPPTAGPSRFALSFAQERLWFLDRLDPASDNYLVSRVSRLRGRFDVEAWRSALDELDHRHHILRTRYIEENGAPWQVVDPPGPAPFEVIDLTNRPVDRQEVDRLVQERCDRGFDLAAGPIWRNTVIILEPNHHIVVTVIHHIASDGWSFPVMIHELSELYKAHTEGRAPSLAPLLIQYADYARWQRDRWERGELEAQMAYWRSKLSGDPAPLELPTDRPRPPRLGSRGGSVEMVVEGVSPSDISQMATSAGMTPFMVGLALLQAFLRRYTDADDIVIGVPSADRSWSKTEGLIGFFVNTLPLRATVSGSMTFAELLESAKKTALEAYENRDAPFERVVQEVRPTRDPSRSPIFQIMYQYGMGVFQRPLGLPGILDEPIRPAKTTSKFDMAINLAATNDGVQVAATFNTDLFEAETVSEMMRHFATLIRGAVANPATVVAELPLVEANEADRLVGLGAPAASSDDHTDVVDAFRAVVRMRPDDPAIVSEHTVTTYRELDQMASGIARSLIDLGAGPNDRIALLLDRTPHLVASMLGALYVCAAFVPLDPDAPDHRRRLILEDAAPAALITNTRLEPTNPGTPTLLVDRDPLSADSLTPIPPQGGSIAYVIYTSGTTGKPKGVLIPRRAFAAYIESTVDAFGITSEDRILQFHSPAFDAALEEIFPILTKGGRMLLRTDDMLGAPGRLLTAAARHGVTILDFPTGYWHELSSQLVEGRADLPATVRLVVMGGDSANPEAVRAWKERFDGHVRLLNSYGPTETTVAVTTADLSATERPGERHVTIGRTLPTARAYVLDSACRPVPVGVPGDLYIGGPQVGHGYHGRSDLTAQVFVEDPFHGGVMYKTGDHARWRRDGQLEFLGRRDRQVKVRGHRVELDEVEAVIGAHPAVAEVAVTAHPGAIVAHVRLRTATTPRRLLVDLGRDLPRYMLPSRIEVMDALPSLSSGKIDRRRLVDKTGTVDPTEHLQRIPDTQRPSRRNATRAPLSYAQRRLWFLDRLMPGVPAYHVRWARRLHGPLDRAALQRAFDFLVARHEVLRTRFEEEFGIPQQVIDPPSPVRITFHDISALADELREDSLQDLLRDALVAPFDLSRDPMLRVSLIRVAVDDHALVVVAHHIATDGGSMEVLGRELTEAYAAGLEDRRPVLPDLPIQYADFAAWQTERMEHGDAGLDFWLDKLAGPLPVVELPRTRTRPTTFTHRGESTSLVLTEEATTRLISFAASERATAFMAWVAVIAATLYRITGETDVILGTPSTERTLLETENLMGFFVNTLPLRVDISDDPSYRDLLGRVRATLLEALEHGAVPFEAMVEHLQPDRHPSHSPVFQMMVGLVEGQDIARSLRFGNLESRPLRSNVMTGTSKFDLSVDGHFREGQVTARFTFNPDVYDREIVDQFARHLRMLVDGVTTSPDSPITALELVTPDERSRLVSDLNPVLGPPPDDRTLGDLFIAQVGLSAPDTALVEGSTTWTFEALHVAAAAIAKRLREAGVRPGDAVGLRMSRSAEAVMAIVGISLAGAVCVPLDPSYPRQLLTFMSEGARVRVIVSRTSDGLAIEPGPRSDDPPAGLSESLAYIMFTSGSDVRPKAVTIPNQSVVSMTTSGPPVQVASVDTVAHMSNIASETSIWEIWSALLNGARLVVVDGHTVESTDLLGHAIDQHGVTALFLPTAMLNRLSLTRPTELSRCRRVLFGGEAPDPEALNRLLAIGSPEELIHVYLSVETGIASWHVVTDVARHAIAVPIGRPTTHATLHVLDERQHLVPIGVVGELYVGGHGLALGYLGDPELTADRFIADPFSTEPGARLFRTGDLVLRRSDGMLVFVGRADRQIKVRGFRVDPSEIEAHLRRIPHVSEALVHVDRRNGEAQLTGYVVAPESAVPEIFSGLSRSLPAHLVPSQIMAVDAFPLTPKGRVDTARLPKPKAYERPEYIAPDTPTMRRMARIWRNVLEVDQVGKEDSFFDLGGHSLLAIRLMADVQHEFGIGLPLAALFEAPTLGRFTSMLDPETSPFHHPSLVVIRKGVRTPLFCIHGGGGHVFVYEPLARHLPPDQTVYGIPAVGIDGVAEPHRTLDEMVEHCASVILSAQPKGPYRLIGYSSGGILAIETARRLSDLGHEVSFLGMIDTGLPRRLSVLQRARRAVDALRDDGRAGLRRTSRLEWPRIRLRLGTLRHGPKWLFYRFLGRGMPPSLASKRLYHVAVRAHRDYEPRPWGGTITYFRAIGGPDGADRRPHAAWERVASRVVLVDIEAAHTGGESIMYEPKATELGVAIRKQLEKDGAP